MKSGKYDISVDQGSTFIFWMGYCDAAGASVDLGGYTASMQVRRSVVDTQLILDIHSDGGVTGGGTTGEFTTGALSGPSGGGSAANLVSGITLNGSTVGVSGSTGGIYVFIDADTMKNVPAGNHHYDFELDFRGVVDKVISGRFEVEGEITR
tara:strand:+ start:6242 stop:6697 length:456 start_codon:yes stop_codon:yes gene_type:complete